jgi:hypothetical protein
LAATERHRRSIGAIGLFGSGASSMGTACADRLAGRESGGRYLPRPAGKSVQSGRAVYQWPVSTEGIRSGQAGRGRRLFHRLRTHSVKSHRFAHCTDGASTVALAATVTYEAPGRQR